MNILSPFLPKFVRLLLHFSRNCRLHEQRDLLLANRWCWGISIWRDRRLLRRKQFCAPIVVAITQCKPALRLALAAHPNIFVAFWQAHTFLAWRPRGFRDQEDISLGIGRHPWQVWDTSRLSALTKLFLYLLDVESSLNCLMSTVWSRRDHLLIVVLKLRACAVTEPLLTSGGSAWHSKPFQTRVMSYAQHASDAKRKVQNASVWRSWW